MNCLLVHSYQQLRQSSELSPKQNKKENPQWVYNAGEEISSVQVIKVRIHTSRKITSIYFFNLFSATSPTYVKKHYLLYLRKERIY